MINAKELEGIKKKYAGLNYPANTYKQAMQEECDKYRQDPQEITNWIEEAADDYMKLEWDDEWKEYGVNYCEHCHRGTKEDDEQKRAEWANQRAWDDFNIFWDDCKTDQDCEEMGFKVIIEGYEDKNGEIIAPEDIMGICPNCEDIFHKDNLPRIPDTDDDDDCEPYCNNCGALFPDLEGLPEEIKKILTPERVIMRL